MKTFTIHYSDGGSSGPYPSAYDAECAARSYVRQYAVDGRKYYVDVKHSDMPGALYAMPGHVSRITVKSCIIAAAVDADIEMVKRLLEVLN